MSSSSSSSSSSGSMVGPLLKQLHPVFSLSVRDSKFQPSLNLCHKILALDPKNAAATDVLLYSLLQSELYTDALKAAAKISHRSTALERAYAMYCTQRFAEADRIIAQQKEDNNNNNKHSQGQQYSTSLKRLQAQAQYRMGNFETSAKIYKSLIESGSASSANNRRSNKPKASTAELYVNTLAALIAQGDLAAVDKLKPQLAGETKSADLAFNLGTALLSSSSSDAESKFENLKEAEKQLVASSKLCHDVCSSLRLSADETMDELAPHVVQLAYARQNLGRAEEAKVSYTHVLSGKPKDPAIVAVASNNLISLRRTNDNAGVFDSLKRSKVALGLSRHLSPDQHRTVALNHSILLLNAKNLKACDSSLQSLASDASSSSSSASSEAETTTVRAALLFRSGKHQKANELLAGFAKSNPGASSVRVRLQLAQQLLVAGKTQPALEEIAAATEHDSRLRHSPGIVSAVVSIQERGSSNADGQAGLETLENAIVYWTSEQAKGDATAANFLNVLRSEKAKLQSRLGKVDEAVEQFQSLARDIDNSTTADSEADRLHRANLIVALSYVDPKQAAKLSDQAGFGAAIDIDDSKVDVDSLLEGFLAYQPKSSREGAASPKQSGGEKDSSSKADEASSADRRAATQARRRAKRRAKQREAFIAKLKEEGRYQENAVPDPERWLPKRLRKKQRGRRRGRQDKTGGAQGAGDVSGRDSQKYDMAAQAKAGAEVNQGKRTGTTKAKGSSSSGRKPASSKKKGGKRGGNKKKK